MGFFSHVETWSCLYWNKGEFDRPVRIDGWRWTRIPIIIIRIGENITWNSMGCYVHNTFWLGMKNVTGFGDLRCFFRFFPRWDRWSFACSAFAFANSTCYELDDKDLKLIEDKSYLDCIWISSSNIEELTVRQLFVWIIILHVHILILLKVCMHIVMPVWSWLCTKVRREVFKFCKWTSGWVFT
jgi:hypothetical protein